MNPLMQGYDKQKARAFILNHLNQKEHRALENELSSLVDALIDAHLSYLHVCGALDESGDTGEGEYDEDEAFEYMLDAVSEHLSDERLNDAAVLIEAFLPAQDAYMEQAGLLGE